MSEPSSKPTKSLQLRQTWFLGLAALAVVLMFAFVILPYVDRRPDKLSGQQSPDFDLELLSGGAPGDRVRLSDLQGSIVVLDFWASWCRPCREQAKVLSELAPALPGDVTILGVATTDEQAAAEAYLQETKPTYSNAFDAQGEVGAALSITQLPTIVILDEDGVIRAVRSNVLSKEELKRMIQTVREAS